MSSEMKIYKIKDFVRKNESGKIDFDRSIKLARELSVAANFHKDHNILIDLRDTTIAIDKIDEMMGLVMEFVQLMPNC